MTVLTLARKPGTLAIAADRAVSRGSQRSRAYRQGKVFGFAGGVYAHTGSLRAGQVVLRSLDEWDAANPDVEEVTNRMRDALKGAGWNPTSDSGLPHCEDFAAVIGDNQGRAYEIGIDLSALRVEDYGSHGCGWATAMGAMHAAWDLDLSPEKVALLGAKAACDLDAYCGAPIDLWDWKEGRGWESAVYFE